MPAPRARRPRRTLRGTLSPYAFALAQVAKHIAGCAPCADALENATREAPQKGWCGVGRPLMEAAVAHAPEAA